MFLIALTLILSSYLSGELYQNSNVYTSSNRIGLGGAGYLFPSPISLKKNPAMNNLNRQFITSIIRYPASITSSSLGLNLPINNFIFTPSIKYVSYGVFKGYDNQANYIGNYSSYETWVGATISKKLLNLPVYLGTHLNWHRSVYSDFLINSFSLDVGIKVFLNKADNAFGLSLHQIGSSRDSNMLVPELVLSGSKKLEYLPAVIYLDCFINNRIKKNDLFLGSIFKINKKLSFMIGSSTRKIDQNTSEKLFKSILGATGFGALYNVNNIVIQYGVYVYGTGAQLYGLDIGMKF